MTTSHDCEASASKHLGLFDEVDGRDGHGLDGPRIHVARQRARPCGKRRSIDDSRLDAESVQQLFGPLLPKAGRRHDERAVAPAPLEQLRQHQTCLNRLTEPYFVGQEKPRCVAANEREGGLELKGKDVDGGPLRPAQLAEGAQFGHLSMQVMHPAPPRHCANSGAASLRDGRVERGEQPAEALRAAGVRAEKIEQRRLGKCRRLFDDPAFSAHGDAIAGSKGHACLWATRMP